MILSIFLSVGSTHFIVVSARVSEYVEKNDVKLIILIDYIRLYDRMK